MQYVSYVQTSAMPVQKNVKNMIMNIAQDAAMCRECAEECMSMAAA